MKSLEEEANYHYDMTYMMAKDESIRIYAVNDFIAGANSKWVQAEKIKAQIEVLQELIDTDGSSYTSRIILLDLKQQLKNLEDENN